MFKKILNKLRGDKTTQPLQPTEPAKKAKFHDVLAELENINDLSTLTAKITEYKDFINAQYQTSYTTASNTTGITGDSVSSVPQFEFGATSRLNLINKYSWIPFAELSLLAQIPLIYNASDTYAKEMQRAGYEFIAINPSDKDEEIIKLLKNEFKKFDIDNLMFKMNLKSFLLGGAMLYPKYKNDTDVLQKELILSKDTPVGALEYFQVIEPTWCYPTNANYADPLLKDFYTPISYNVISYQMHASRLHKMVYNDVPDLIRPIYMHYGISLTQKILNAIAKYDDLNDVIFAIINRLNLIIFSVKLSEYKNNQEMLKQKVQNFNKVANNFGAMICDVDCEKIEQITLSLQHLDELFRRYIEIICIDLQMPATKFMGISPTGFSNVDESSHKNWADLIMGLLEHMNKPMYDNIIRHILLNKGIDTDNYTVKFNNLHQPSALEEAQIREIDSRVDSTYVQSGIILPEDVAKTITTDKDSRYNGIDVINVPDDVDDKLLQENEQEYE